MLSTTEAARKNIEKRAHANIAGPAAEARAQPGLPQKAAIRGLI
jgi:hypothetical protein